MADQPISAEVSQAKPVRSLVTIEYADCAKCDETLWMAVTRGRIARWRHNKSRWRPVWHRPDPIECIHSSWVLNEVILPHVHGQVISTSTSGPVCGCEQGAIDADFV